MEKIRIYSGSTYRWSRIADDRFKVRMDAWRVRSGFRYFDVVGVMGRFDEALQWPCGEEPFVFMQVVNRLTWLDDFKEGWIELKVQRVCDNERYAEFLKHFENQ